MTEKLTPAEARAELGRRRTIGKPYHGRVRRRTEYRGQWYDSKHEANVAFDLDQKIAIGEIASYDRQVPFHMVHRGVRLYSYRADFVVHFPDGREEVWDAKAFWIRNGKRVTHDAKWPLIKRLMRAFFDIDVREV